MFNKPSISINKNRYLPSINKGVIEAVLFSTVYASIIGLIYWICSTKLSITGVESGASFAYLVGCSFFVRSHLLKIIKHTQEACNADSTALESVAAVITVILFVYTTTLYFSTNI